VHNEHMKRVGHRYSR